MPVRPNLTPVRRQQLFSRCDLGNRVHKFYGLGAIDRYAVILVRLVRVREVLDAEVVSFLPGEVYVILAALSRAIGIAVDCYEGGKGEEEREAEEVGGAELNLECRYFSEDSRWRRRSFLPLKSYSWQKYVKHGYQL